MDLKTKKAFTLAEIAIVFVIIALIAVAGIKITKSRTNHVNKYMSYAAFTNLKQGMGELIADNKTLPAYGVAPVTATCPLTPDPSAICDDSGVTFTHLQVAPADTAYSMINTCVGSPLLSWDPACTDPGSCNCVNNSWAAAKYSCSLMGAGWHLPTSQELCSMYKYRAYISSPMYAEFYWSTTEYNANTAQGKGFTTGSIYNDTKGSIHYTRCVK